MPEGPVPKFHLGWTPADPRVDETIRFKVEAESDDPVVDAAWDFGDGTGSHDLTPEHVYRTPDTYTMQITLETLGGHRTRLSQALLVREKDGSLPGATHDPAPPGPEDPSQTVPLPEPTLDAILTRNRLVATFDWDRTPTAIEWDFGDGTTSQEGRHDYLAVGTYDLRLTLWDGARTASATTPLHVVSVPFVPHVVVATFDTGVNPFHPTWRTDDARPPADFIPGYPAGTVLVNLTLSDDADADWQASQGEWSKVGPNIKDGVAFPGTRIIMARAATSDPTPLFDRSGDSHYHGARASSQIAGTGYAVGDHAYVVIMDMTGGASGDTYESFIAAGMDWINEQDWIDIIHVNMAFPAPYPTHPAMMDGFIEAAEKGKLVVLPAGNGLGNTGATPPYPMETQHTTGAPTTFVAGANDQCPQGAWWSNLDPHVVMDGAGTVAAESIGYGDAPFSGTSSASPRTAGYAAELLYRLRVHYNDTLGAHDGAMLVLTDPAFFPTQGPLADGRLTSAEFHEAIRKTAAPSHDSEFDGDSGLLPCPGATETGWGLYLKEGYGEVSEHTLDAAFDALTGSAPMPDRPQEDTFYEASEAYRWLWYEESPV